MISIVGSQMPALDLNSWKADDLLKAMALLGAVLAFIVGLVQYRKSQRWKRAEWVAQEMKTLFADPSVQAALSLIDWSSIEIRKIFPSRGKEAGRSEILCNKEINEALRPHWERGGFTPLEGDIRAAFDHLFDGIERFESYYATGLVRKSDLRPYLRYWGRKICDKEATEGDRAHHLRAYMKAYEFTGAVRLLGHLAKPALLDRILGRRAGRNMRGREGKSASRRKHLASLS